jgi:hypothetical protein
MSVRTHTSSWRQLVAFAPLLGAAFIFMGAVQGEPGMALSRTVYWVLAPVSLAGWWVAWRLLRVLSDTPITPVAQAAAGYVALRGKAGAMPGRPPLTTPSGVPCVWYSYRYSSGATHSGFDHHAGDTVQPFVLEDESGQCIVLPAGADITGGQEGTTPGRRERLIVPGDTIYVAGEFRLASPETASQVRAVEAEPMDVSVTLPDDPSRDMDAARKLGERMLKEAVAAKAAAAAIRPEPPALPVVCAPKYGAFVITANQDGTNEGSWYGLLATANLVLLIASGAMLVYLIGSGR